MAERFYPKLLRAGHFAIISKCFLFAGACLVLVCRCTSIGSLSGTSEQGNARVFASVFTPSGDPASGASVHLRRADFLSGIATVSQSNSRDLRNISVTEDGSFSLDSLDTGSYALEVNDNAGGATLFRFTISRTNQTVPLSADTLRPYAAIRGTVDVGGGFTKRYVQVQGLERLAVIDSNGTYAFNDLPAGTFTLRFPNANSTVAPSILDNIAIGPGQTVQISYSLWKYSKTLYLNTTPAGANISRAVYGFPLLVRLTNGNFMFNQAKSDGSDVRFAKANGTPLPFEIARWDVAAGAAEIWVRVDTVYGNNAAQHIAMSWGNAAAAGRSGGSVVVFDTSNGFLGVWHLDSNCNDDAGNGHNGTNYGANDVPGIIGSAKQFSGNDSIKIAGLLGTPAMVTLSAWVKTDTTVSSGQDIVTIGDAALIRADETVGAYGTGGYAHRYTRNSDTAFTKVTSGVNIAKTGWRFIAFVFDSEAQTHTLYIDGAPVRVDNSAYPIDYTGVGSNTFIGMHGNGKLSYAMRGMVDEVRICGIARSADWIKLCYMNQRPDDKLIIAK